MPSNITVKVATFGRWTLREKAPRCAPYLQRWVIRMKKLTLIWFISIFAGEVNAELFELRKFEMRDSYAFVEFEYGEKKGVPFVEAFSCLTLEKNEVTIRILGSFSQETNEQLLSYYREKMPQELGVALQSYGNLHNPAIAPLKKSFAAAFRGTAMYKDIEKELAKFGYKNSKIEFEKYSINTMGSPQIQVADIWLNFVISPNKSKRPYAINGAGV